MNGNEVLKEPSVEVIIAKLISNLRGKKFYNNLFNDLFYRYETQYFVEIAVLEFNEQQL